MSIIIDANLILYQCMAVLTTEKALRDSHGRITSHLKILLSKVLMYDKAGIKQTWVFDNQVRNPRKKQRPKSSGVILEREHFDEIKEMLLYMGIFCLTAPPGIEAEQLGAWLTRGELIENRLYQYILTTDSDVLIFGGNMLRQYTEGKPAKIKYSIFEYNDLLRDLEITRDELLCIAGTMGHDFGEKSRGIAKKSVYRKVKNGHQLTPEQTESLAQFELLDDDYIDSAVGVQEPYNSEMLISMLVERNFNETKLRQDLESFNSSL
jgi:5'-3' exonuclease